MLRAGWGRRVIRPTGVSRDHGRLSPTCPVDTSTREQLAASPNAACGGGRSADEVEYAVVVHVVRGRGVADLAEGDDRVTGGEACDLALEVHLGAVESERARDFEAGLELGLGDRRAGLNEITGVVVGVVAAGVVVGACGVIARRCAWRAGPRKLQKAVPALARGRLAERLLHSLTRVALASEG